MSSFKITKIHAREIIDCRGWPTVQADVWVDGRLMGRADVASGRSTGSHEAHVLLDGDKSRYRGLGVLKAVENVNNVIGPELVGWEVTEQRKIDLVMKEMDGTANKSKLGANAIWVYLWLLPGRPPMSTGFHCITISIRMPMCCRYR